MYWVDNKYVLIQASLCSVGTLLSESAQVLLWEDRDTEPRHSDCQTHFLIYTGTWKKITKSIVVMLNEFLRSILCILTDTYWALTGGLALWIQSVHILMRNTNFQLDECSVDRAVNVAHRKYCKCVKKGVARSAWWLVEVRDQVLQGESQGRFWESQRSGG